MQVKKEYIMKPDEKKLNVLKQFHNGRIVKITTQRNRTHQKEDIAKRHQQSGKIDTEHKKNHTNIEEKKHIKKKQDKQTQTEKEPLKNYSIKKDKCTNTCCDLIKLHKEHEKALEKIKEKNIEIDLLKHQTDLMEWKIDNEDILDFEMTTDKLNISNI